MLKVEVVELLADHAWVNILTQEGEPYIEIRVDFENGKFQAPWVAERDNWTNVLKQYPRVNWVRRF